MSPQTMTTITASSSSSSSNSSTTSSSLNSKCLDKNSHPRPINNNGPLFDTCLNEAPIPTNSINNNNNNNNNNINNINNNNNNNCNNNSIDNNDDNNNDNVHSHDALKTNMINLEKMVTLFWVSRAMEYSLSIMILKTKMTEGHQ